MNIFLTGQPGCGKTTALEKTIKRLKKKGLKVGGFLSPEVRKAGRRWGFKLLAIHEEKEGILASCKQPKGPRISSYRINLEDLNKFSSILDEIALSDRFDVICLDEIGPMELKSERFSKALDKCIQSAKPLLATLHQRFVKRFNKKGKVLKINRKNRKKIPKKLSTKILIERKKK